MNQIQQVLEKVYNELEKENIFRNPAKVFTNIEKSKPMRYCFIMDELYSRDISKDREYQKTFGGFYQIRLKWYKKFYCVLEKNKHRGKARSLTLKKVMRFLYKYNHSFEYSFTSKLLHTVNALNPVIDKKVLGHLGLKRPQRPGRRLNVRDVDALFHVYENQYELVKKVYKLLLMKPEIKKLFARFDSRFPYLAKIGDMKKIDLILWRL